MDKNCESVSWPVFVVFIGTVTGVFVLGRNILFGGAHRLVKSP